MTDNKRVTTEDILGEFGFRVRWSVSDTWADVAVFDITGRDANSNVALFNRRDWVALPDPVESIEEAESYLEGFVKWDGCTELNQGQPHWCGPEDYKKHIALLRYIYRRAFELMGHEPETPWGEEATDSDKSSGFLIALKGECLQLIGDRIDEKSVSGLNSFVEMENGVIHYAGEGGDRYFRVNLVEVDES